LKRKEVLEIRTKIIQKLAKTMNKLVKAKCK